AFARVAYGFGAGTRQHDLAAVGQERARIAFAAHDRARHHRAREIEIEWELDARGTGVAIEGHHAVVPGAERRDAVASLIADRAEHVARVDQADRDQRVVEPAAVARERGERGVELLAREPAAAHQVLAEQLVALRRGDVQEPALVEVNFLARADAGAGAA